MKPLQVALLVVVSAVAGGLFMKWQISRNAAQVAVAVPAAPPVQAATPAPVPVQQPVVTQSQPAEPEEPAPVIARKPPKTSAKPHEVLKSHRAAPVVMARNEEPAVVEPAMEAAPAVVQAEPQVVPPATAAPETVQQPEQPEPVASAPAPVQAPAPLQVTLKAGTLIPARTVEGLSSDRNAPGDGFTATLDQPLVADGWVIAERGAHLEGKVVETGRGKGQSDLVIVLTQLKTSDGQRVAIETDTFAKHAQASTGESAAKVVAGAAIGAAIGAIAGGGKGAAIGAGVGTAAGAGGAVATRAKSAVLPAETLVHFRLKNSVTVTERQGRS